jgi:hypothetical protein
LEIGLSGSRAECHLLPSSSNAPPRIDASLRVTKWGAKGRSGEVDLVIKPHIPPELKNSRFSGEDPEMRFVWTGVSYLSSPHCYSVDYVGCRIDCLEFRLDCSEGRAAHHIAMASIVPFPVAVTFIPILEGSGWSAFPAAEFRDYECRIWGYVGIRLTAQCRQHFLFLML